MAQKSKQPFNYVAHVQKDGQTLELAGTIEEYTVKKVYQILLQKAAELGGWLLSQHIEEADAEPEVVRTSLPVVVAPKAHKRTFGNIEHFGTYQSTYRSPLKLKFKEK